VPGLVQELGLVLAPGLVLEMVWELVWVLVPGLVQVPELVLVSHKQPQCCSSKLPPILKLV